MAKLVQERWSCNDNKPIQRRAHSGGKKDEAEVCKILEWKDEVGKSRVGWVMVKLTWLDHMQPVIYKSRDCDITIAFSLRHKLRQTFKYECSLVKNLLTY